MEAVPKIKYSMLSKKILFQSMGNFFFCSSGVEPATPSACCKRTPCCQTTELSYALVFELRLPLADRSFDREIDVDE